MDRSRARQAVIDREGAAMFVTHDREVHETGLPGIRMKTLCFGDRTLMVEFRLAAGSVLPDRIQVSPQ